MSKRDNSSASSYNDTRKARRERYRYYAKLKGFDNDFINKFRLYDKSSLYIDTHFQDLKKEQSNYRRHKTLKAKKKRNKEILIDKGFHVKDIKKSWLTRNEDFINNLDPTDGDTTLYISKYYLAIMFCDLTGESIFYTTSVFSNWSLNEIISKIHEIYDAALSDVDNSNGFKGVYIAYWTTELTNAEQFTHDFSKRGYDIKAGKFMRESYDTIAIRNDWTIREFAEMMLLVISNLKNDHVISFYEQMHDYIKIARLPFHDIF